MILTTTSATITCDQCGRVIEAGEEWHQVAQLVAAGIYDGANGGLAEVSSSTTQACATCWASRVGPAAALVASVRPA